MLEDSKNEIQNRLDKENRKLSKIEQNIGDIVKHGDINPFDFNDIDQPDHENILNEFVDIAENTKTKNDRTLVFDVIVDSQRDDFPFILHGEFIFNDGERFQVNRFYKEINQLTKSIEKMIDR